MTFDAGRPWPDVHDMSLDEIDASIRELELRIGPTLARISTLKKAARGRRAAAASAKVRAAKAPAESIKARFSAIPGSRGRIELLAQEFDRSPRTIHRKLGPKGSRK